MAYMSGGSLSQANHLSSDVVFWPFTFHVPTNILQKTQHQWFKITTNKWEIIGNKRHPNDNVILVLNFNFFKILWKAIGI